jgi:hypothetical protein
MTLPLSVSPHKDFAKTSRKGCLGVFWATKTRSMLFKRAIELLNQSLTVA